MNTFKFIRCSKKRCSSLFDDYFSKYIKGPLGLMFDIHSFEAKNKLFEFIQCSKNEFVRSLEFHQCVQFWQFWVILLQNSNFATAKFVKVKFEILFIVWNEVQAKVRSIVGKFHGPVENALQFFIIFSRHW